jgi:hypothetical protein
VWRGGGERGVDGSARASNAAAACRATAMGTLMVAKSLSRGWATTTDADACSCACACACAGGACLGAARLRRPAAEDMGGAAGTLLKMVHVSAVFFAMFWKVPALIMTTLKETPVHRPPHNTRATYHPNGHTRPYTSRCRISHRVRTFVFVCNACDDRDPVFPCCCA